MRWQMGDALMRRPRRSSVPPLWLGIPRLFQTWRISRSMRPRNPGDRHDRTRPAREMLDNARPRANGSVRGRFVRRETLWRARRPIDARRRGGDMVARRLTTERPAARPATPVAPPVPPAPRPTPLLPVLALMNGSALLALVVLVLRPTAFNVL